jgi:hypothetical protein
MTELELREQVQLDAGVTFDIMWQGSRITRMLNQAQDWLQEKLIKQGYKSWIDESTISSVSASTFEGLVTAKGTLPTDLIRSMPIESVFPKPTVVGLFVQKSWQFVKSKNFNFVANNPVTAPSTQWGIYGIDVDSIHIYPAGAFSTIDIRYSRKITDLVYDDNSTNSEIPDELQWILVERVVMQIKSIDGNEQVKQAKVAEIDKELMQKYQLDALVKNDEQDRSQVQ